MPTLVELEQLQVDVSTIYVMCNGFQRAMEGFPASRSRQLPNSFAAGSPYLHVAKIVRNLLNLIGGVTSLVEKDGIVGCFICPLQMIPKD
jgi:hypothetical protein